MQNPPVVPGPFLPLTTAVRSPSLRQRRLPPGFAPIPGVDVPPDSASTFDLSRFVWLNGSKLFAYAAASAKVVDAPAGADNYRVYLSIRNVDAVAVLYVDFGQAASANSECVLQPGEIRAFDAVIPQDDIYIAGSAGGNASISYSNKTIPSPP